MKSLLTIMLVCILAITSRAQTPGLDWAVSLGGTTSDQGNSIAVDAQGNVYLTGYFSGTADFDPGPGTFNLSAVDSNDIFIQKLDASGNLAWAVAFGGAMLDEGWSVSTDPAANVYVCGRFQGTVDFNPGSGAFNLSSNGDRDIFILKLDASGSFIWAKGIGGTGRDDAYSITTDAGNLLLTGRFEGTVDFDPGSAVHNLVSNGNRDVFIQKLDASGNYLWAVSLGDIHVDRGYSIDSDASGNVYVTGYYAGTVDFDPSMPTAWYTANGSDDIFILKLNASGTFAWVRSIGGTEADEGRAVVIDASGNIIITGSFQSIVDFDPGTSVFNMTSHDSLDIFVLKLDAGGNFVWAKSLGDVYYDCGQSVATDALGNVYVTGSFSGTVDFDPGPAVFNLISNGSEDIFGLKLDPTGNYLWAISMGGNAIDQGHSIATNAAGNVYVTGFYQGTVDFSPVSVPLPLTSNGADDIFCLKLNQSGIGITKGDQPDGISVFPVPVNETVNVTLGDLQDVTIEIYTPGGQLVHHEEGINSAVHVFRLEAAPGIYLLEVSAQQARYQYKLLKL